MGNLAHAICTALDSTDGSRRRIKKFYSYHKSCKSCGLFPSDVPTAEHDDFHLHLAILGACRQLYEEGFHILWTTNNFAFGDPHAFKIFLSLLGSAQKRKLTAVTISVYRPSYDVFCSAEITHELTDWRLTYATSPFVTALRSIKSLQLNIHIFDNFRYPNRDVDSTIAFRSAYLTIGALRA